MTTPLDLPPEIAGPSAWYGPDIATRTDWVHEFGPDQLAEIELAIRGMEAADISPAMLRRDAFPLPTVGPWLLRILAEVQDGRGFALLRGLPVHTWGPRRSALAFLALGLHIGRLRPQNAAGHLFGHVRDQGLSSRDPAVRIYQTRERQNYHTDSCDVVGLLCLHPAKTGGLSSLVSSVTIFNGMGRLRPDLVGVLFEPIETDRRGEVPAGQQPYFRIPVFNWHAGLLTTIYHRQYIESARRFPHVPRLTSLQIEALDAFDGLANDPALHFFMELRAGDIQLVNNHSLLHDRTAFEDWPEPARRRHLLRVWLAPAPARPLPAVFAERYGSVIPGERSGIRVHDSALTIPWGPEA